MVDYAGLKGAFEGDIVEPGAPDYAAAISRWGRNYAKKARYVLFPKSDADVALGIKFASSNKIPLAIKCGGHNVSGASSVQDGVCIDLSRYFNTTRVDPDKKLAYVGGGAVWKTVDEATAAHGLGTPGGTVNHTGVAGLTLAGGYGWLTGEHGLTIDNLVEARIVTADGSIVTASETSNGDLFWAIRGGGSNFGIVTEFVFKLHPQRKTVFAGHVIFAASLIPKIAELVDEWYPRIGEKEALFVGATRGPPPERVPCIVFILFYNGSEEEGRANFKQFYDLGPIADMAREVPYEELNSINNMNAIPGRNYYMSGTSARSRLATNLQSAFDHMAAVTAAHPDADSGLPPFEMLIGFECYAPGKACTVSPDATAFRSRGTQPNVVILVTWDEEKEGKEGTPYARGFARGAAKIFDTTEERAPKENENHGYGNYVSDTSDMKAHTHKLWGNNYPRLQKIKKIYDPDLIFNRWFPITPAD